MPEEGVVRKKKKEPRRKTPISSSLLHAIRSCCCGSRKDSSSSASHMLSMLEVRGVAATVFSPVGCAPNLLPLLFLHLQVVFLHSTKPLLPPSVVTAESQDQSRISTTSTVIWIRGLGVSILVQPSLLSLAASSSATGLGGRVRYPRKYYCLLSPCLVPNLKHANRHVVISVVEFVILLPVVVFCRASSVLHLESAKIHWDR